jgi:ankyrin repeat protein
MNRTQFLKKGTLAVGSTLLLGSFTNTPESSLFTAKEIDEFVGAAHGSLEETKRIIEAKPLILNCTSQLAQGDFETAIGGASHMGRKDIADLLVSKGARMDIFNFTFLGYTDFVKKLLNDQPQLLNSYGPHGYTLLHHAKAGGHTDFANWLTMQGLTKDIFDHLFDF